MDNFLWVTAGIGVTMLIGYLDLRLSQWIDDEEEVERW